jgi:uncharacterized protein YuzE
MSARYRYDGDADALYVYINDPRRVERTIEVVDAAILVDVDTVGSVVGVEILSPRPSTDLTPLRKHLSGLQFAAVAAFMSVDHHAPIEAIRAPAGPSGEDQTP